MRSERGTARDESADQPPATGWKAWLFPQRPRDFPLRRTTRLILRTAHILTSGTLLGGVIFQQEWALLQPWWIGMVVTGLLLFLTDLHATAAVLLQVSGVVVIVKMLLVFAAGTYPSLALPLLLVALVIGAISSHMPGRYRHHYLLPGKRFVADERRG